MPNAKIPGNYSPATKEEIDNGYVRIDYDDEKNPAFINKNDRAWRVQGHGPIGVALVPDESSDEDKGFLKDNNVSDRI